MLEQQERRGGEYIFPRWRKFESQIAGRGRSNCSNKNRLEPLPASSVFAHSFILAKGYRAVFPFIFRLFRLLHSNNHILLLDKLSNGRNYNITKI